MPKLLSLAGFAYTVAAAGLSSCCDCSASDDPPFLNFAFSADSLGGTGFRRAELRTAYVVTYREPGFQGPRDTTRQPLPGTASTGSLLLYPSSKLPGATEFALYAQPTAPRSYRIFVPTANRIYDLDNVAQPLSDRKGDGCNCDEVKEQRFTINGQPHVIDRSGITSQTPTLLFR